MGETNNLQPQSFWHKETNSGPGWDGPNPDPTLEKKAYFSFQNTENVKIFKIF